MSDIDYKDQYSQAMVQVVDLLSVNNALIARNDKLEKQEFDLKNTIHKLQEKQKKLTAEHTVFLNGLMKEFADSPSHKDADLLNELAKQNAHLSLIVMTSSGVHYSIAGYTPAIRNMLSDALLNIKKGW